MRIRTKVLLITLASFVLCAGIVFVVTNTLFQLEPSGVENQEARSAVNKLQAPSAYQLELKLAYGEMVAQVENLESQRWVLIFGTGMILLGFLALLVFYHVLDRQIHARLLGLNQNLALITARQDRSLRIEVTGKDEFSELAKSINQMLAEIEHSQMDMQSARTELEQRVKERTAALHTNEEALKESEQQYRTTLDALDDMVHVVDKNRRLILWNSTWQRKMQEVFGITGDFAGKDILTVIPKPLKNSAAESLEVFESGKPLFSQVKTEVNGKDVFLETNRIPIYNGLQVERVVTLIRDVTPHKMIEERANRLLDQQMITNKLAIALGNFNDLQSIYQTIYEHISELMDINTFILSSLDTYYNKILPRYVVLNKSLVVDLNSMPVLGLTDQRRDAQLEVLKSGKPLYLADLPAEMRLILNDHAVLPKTGMLHLLPNERPVQEIDQSRSAVLSPMRVRGKTVGVFQVRSLKVDGFTLDDMSMLTGIANVAAVAIQNAGLIVSLEQINHELTRSYDSTLEGWAKALEMRDKETEGHSERVTMLTLELAEALNIGHDELIHVRRGALLHDIGKMAVPDSILNKPGPLSDEEWVIMRHHPRYAYEMLANIDYLRPALNIPLYHHEWWNGSGYPEGLKEDTIPISARIFAIIDVWDALRSDRPYRPAWSREKTFNYINDLSGVQFDPRVVKAFTELIAKRSVEFN